MTSTRLLTVSLFFMTVFGSKAMPNYRIFGGADAPSGYYTWAASIRVDDVHSCSGSIIHDYFVITAARCVAPVSNSRLSVRVGSINQFAGGQIATVHSVFVHPYFGNFLHDIALLKLEKAFSFNNEMSKIALAGENEVTAEGAQVVVTGWGLLESGLPSFKLRYLLMSVLGKAECERRAGFGYDSVICLNSTEQKGICHGDEGAGIVSGTKLVAVASFYFGTCGTKYPDVASSISYYNSWIKSIIEKN